MGHTQDLRDFASVVFRNLDQLDDLPGIRARVHGSTIVLAKGGGGQRRD